MCVHQVAKLAKNDKGVNQSDSVTFSNISYTIIQKKYGGGAQGDGRAHNYVCAQKQCVCTRWPNWLKMTKG